MEEILKKIRALMVLDSFDAGIVLALMLDDPYLLLELVDGCKIEDDGTITLNETFETNAIEESYDILVDALFKMILRINDIQNPESSLKLENIKVLDLCSFVKLPLVIDSFTNLETIIISPKHSSSIPKEYSSIKDLQIKTVLSAPAEEKSQYEEKEEIKLMEPDQDVPSNFKKNLDELISRFPSEPRTYAVDDQLTEDYWSNYYPFRDMQEVAVEEPYSLPDLVSFPSIVDDLFGDPVNIDDLQYFHDRVYGIRISEEIFGFIIKRADDDEIQKSLDDADYVIKEQLILKSNHEYFIELLSLILQVEFCKKYIDKN